MNIQMRGDGPVIIMKTRPEAMMIETDAAGVSKPAVVTVPATYAVYDPHVSVEKKQPILMYAALAVLAYMSFKS